MDGYLSGQPEGGNHPGSIANTLAVEGSTYRHDRVTWYTVLAHEVCEAA